ncbi:MAG: GH3 auxin-responsive promoter family protein [Treponema sp.]|jgi:hypothetical protein|nr:GH3 auxin-responsive promoter family protein [Treponema sp.]
MKEPRIKKWWLIKLALTIIGKKGLREMRKASKNGKKASDGILRQILTICRDTAPGEVSHITDYKTRYYAIMRMSIERNCTLIVTANPSTLVEMQINDNEFFDDYCDDIEHGTVSQKFPITDAEEFTACVDKCLQEYNGEYREKRASNRVKAPETALLGPESFERFKAVCIDRGYRDGQFKLNLLMQDEKRHAMFKELVK